MARRLVTTQALLCDWHAALGTPQEVEATAQRTVHAKALDLCGFCALVWDFCGPRLDEIKDMIRPDVLEALLRSARTPKDAAAESAGPFQLTMPEEPAPATLAEPRPQARKSPSKPNGEWVEGTEQVICPLPHRPGTPKPYWVRYRDRGSHAKGSHHLLGPQIAYRLPDPNGPDAITLNVFCHEHQVCVDAGGYGFQDENGLRCHIARSKQWPKARKDAAATAART